MDLGNVYYTHCSVPDSGALMFLKLTELWQLNELLPIIDFIETSTNTSKTLTIVMRTVKYIKAHSSGVQYLCLN